MHQIASQMRGFAPLLPLVLAIQAHAANSTASQEPTNDNILKYDANNNIGAVVDTILGRSWKPSHRQGSPLDATTHAKLGKPLDTLAPHVQSSGLFRAVGPGNSKPRVRLSASVKVEELKKLMLKDKEDILRRTGGRKTRSGRRVLKQRVRTEQDDLSDFGQRFEGARTLLKAGAWWMNMDVRKLSVGQMVVMMEDQPTANLVKGQNYDIVRIYYQNRDDWVGTNRLDVDSFSSPLPANATSLMPGVWDLWCELYSPEYHGGYPVKVRVQDTKMRSVGDEVMDALPYALSVTTLPLSLLLYGAVHDHGAGHF
jgi:hypothetical protein